MRILLTGLLAVGMGGAVPRAFAAAGPTAVAAVADLNAWRALVGEAPVTGYDAQLAEGCRLHNAYLQRNNTGGHGEDSGLPGYSELGAQAGGSSVLVDALVLPREGFARAVFHRLALVQPRLQTTWFDASDGNTCIGVFGTSNTVRTAGLTLYPWPYDGQTRVPQAFADNEVPSPYDDVPGATDLGYPLSVQVNGPWSGDETVQLTSATLTSAGTPVAVTGVDSTSTHGDVLSGGFALLPNARLAEHRWYVASAAGVVTTDAADGAPATYPFSLSWSFRTDWPVPKLEISTWSDGRLQAIGQSGAPVKFVYSRDGVQVASQWTRPRRRIVPKVRGRYDVCLSQNARGQWAATHACFPSLTIGRHTHG